MKIFVQVVDIRTGIYQSGMIDEPVVKGKEIENALLHFGVSYGNVSWLLNEPDIKSGRVNDTTKLVNVIIQVVSDQPSFVGKSIGD